MGISISKKEISYMCLRGSRFPQHNEWYCSLYVVETEGTPLSWPAKPRVPYFALHCLSSNHHLEQDSAIIFPFTNSIMDFTWFMSTTSQLTDILYLLTCWSSLISDTSQLFHINIAFYQGWYPTIFNNCNLTSQISVAICRMTSTINIVQHSNLCIK